MTPVFNEFVHPHKEGEYGDCQRAVICAILDLPRNSVPHFAEGNPSSDVFHDRLDGFLASVGRKRWSQHWEYGQHTLRMAMERYEHPWALIGDSRNGWGHAVVCVGGAIVHDPSGGGIVSGMKDGGWMYWYDIYPLEAVHGREKERVLKLLEFPSRRWARRMARYEVEAAAWRAEHGVVRRG